jgi:hypothetical protein
MEAVDSVVLIPLLVPYVIFRQVMVGPQDVRWVQLEALHPGKQPKGCGEGDGNGSEDRRIGVARRENK